MREKNKRVAIACQGGGTHTAFTAGVLKRLLGEKEKKFDIVTLSGSSGGAICAVLTWYGLQTKGREKAIELLNSFWEDVSANSFWDMYFNNFIVWATRLRDFIPMADYNPNLYPDAAQRRLRAILEKHIDFEKIKELVNESSPLLLAGAVNVLTGQFKIFRNEEITADALLASAATPDLFKAVRIGEDIYWDGLYSENPPIRGIARTRPDEIWVIQTNPPARRHVPTTTREIRDRRRELTGNLSLEQKLSFIEKINEFVKNHPMANKEYKQIDIKRILMLRDLDEASGLERSPAFIRGMMTYGEEQAEAFLKRG